MERFLTRPQVPSQAVTVGSTHTCGYVAFHSKGVSADVIKVPDRWAVRQGDSPAPLINPKI